MNRILLPLLMPVLLLACQPTEELTVTDPRIRWLPGDGPMAGYADVHNASPVDRQLVAVSSKVFARVMLHESVAQDGRMQMRHRASITVPAKGSVSFSPGGLHMMLMQPQLAIQPGDAVTMELHFDDGQTRSAEFQVRAPGDV